MIKWLIVNRKKTWVESVGPTEVRMSSYGPWKLEILGRCVSVSSFFRFPVSKTWTFDGLSYKTKYRILIHWLQQQIG